MAHIQGIGRGGDPTGERDTLANVMWLCMYHHDLLDGRAPMKLLEIQAALHEIVRLRAR